MSDDVIEVGDGNFNDEIINSLVPVLVDFWGPACGPCKILEPIIQKLAIEYQDQIKVAKVNVDSNPKIAMQYAVKALPTLLLFDRGKVLNQFMGQLTKSALDKFVQNSL